MNAGIVSTIEDRCRRCYSCIRECPAKAIRVENGQARVIPERCISCGHCIKVCSQNAKQVASDVELVFNHFLGNGRTVAIVAPSFAASFPDNYLKVPAALKALGFGEVVETAFGADLISKHYTNFYQSEDTKTIITSSCPAVVNFIEMYYKELVPNLARVVSPMIALGRYLKTNYGENTKVVFIGPCVAKKSEAIDPDVAGAIDGVLTFTELKEVFREKNILLDELEDSYFDPPHAYLGKSYPLSGGLLKSSGISGDVLEKETIVVEGRKRVVELIEEISDNKINAKFVDLLFCEGCINGPAIDSDLNYYSKREKVIKFVEQNIHSIDKYVWKSNIYNSRNIDFTREFRIKNQRRPYPTESTITRILNELQKHKITDELNCGACGYGTCREFAVAIAKGLAEKEMCLPLLIEQLAKAYDDLNSAEDQLRTAEKLASIGQLAAGVAHEINNPLGSIMLYSSMLKKALAKNNIDNEQSAEDLSLIIEEATRCKNIVANLLNFARQGKLNIEQINMFNLLSEITRGVKMHPVHTDVKIEFENSNGYVIDGDKDQLKQVFLNLINNACESMEDSEHKKLVIKIYTDGEYIITQIKDTGGGIPKENFGKIFTPFFTTKKIGKGTGLGLAITYGIIKMHRGHITFESNPDEGTTFKIKLPKNISLQEQSVI
ncbi:MAG: 4Fe-4S dicluster domain-containing protein [Ignavibacteriaceae bacterium]|nr:4Fe-4S dicluster domain-containing protein [Ignavibacteriaceae bacterium]